MLDEIGQTETSPGLEGTEGAESESAPPCGAIEESEESQAGEPSTREAPEPKPKESLKSLHAAITQGFAELQGAFEDKLAFDHSKERQIDRLHAELQEHKGDLIGKTKRPLIQGVLRLHDDLGKVVAALRRKPEEDLTVDRFFSAFDGIVDDIELLLGQHGVESFRLPDEHFNPRLQTVLRTRVTENTDLVGTIAEHLRPGFTEGEALLQKERVAVYVHASKTTPETAPKAMAPGPVGSEAVNLETVESEEEEQSLDRESIVG